MAYSGVVYSRRIGDEELTFGVSGLLYRSNVLMYDHQSESLWSQILRHAVTGPRRGAKLDVLPSTLTRWDKWRAGHPRTLVLTTATGYDRDYSRDPYEDYYRRRSGLFGFLRAGPGEEDKELVVGIEKKGVSRAYPLSVVRQRGQLEDSVGGEKLSFRYDKSDDRLRITDSEGRTVPHVTTYWFVWKAFHPQTERFE
ncbi:hypothetical protein C2E25_01200 [Geothermobacter hydrogeniphilus]|uniref:DUF3179 domain-containing protein n=1 Tax=Geothermobacter hydrogeniphilus TaxID=1969733 RepID=A0A2K2HE28_9BACT|nr:hypothetical protein C2E25_01200 [Geothermobacter hydrogeniphilus]